MFAAHATEWHVYSETRNGLTGNQQLTNAFIRAQANDTITIHAGTYNLATEEMTFRYETDANGTLHATAGTCLYSRADNLTVQGDSAVASDEIVLSGLGSNAVTQDGQHAILRLDGANCTVRHLAFYKGTANYNAIVYRNGVQQNTDKWVYRRGGGLALKNDAIVEDCVFDACYAGQGACVYGGLRLSACAFKNSNAVANNAGCAVADAKGVYDSHFEGNMRGALRGCSTAVSNCTFVANSHGGGTGLLWYHTGALVDCAFTNNTTTCLYLHGAKYMPTEIARCTFSGNSDTACAAGIGGPNPCTTPVTDCTFVGTLQVSNVTATVSGCTFVGGEGMILDGCPNVVDSTFTGGGNTITGSSSGNVTAIRNSGFKRCAFKGLSLHWAYGFENVHTMENCLVTETVQWGTGALFAHTDGLDATYLNCTIVSNGALNTMYANTADAGTVTFRNSIFWMNKVGGQAWNRVDFWNTATELSRLRMDYSVFHARGTAGTIEVAGEGSTNKNYHDPRLKITAKPDEIHGDPYALYRKSPYVNAGDNGSWTADDKDLAGNPRLNGTVDLGCYENWDRAPGLFMRFR